MTGKALKIVCLGILVLLLGIPSLAQNTKGDKPTPPDRETRFKTPKKSKQKAGRKVRRSEDKAGKKVSPSQRATRRERAGRPLNPAVVRSQPRGTQQAWRGDIAGQRIRTRSSSSRARNVHPQPGNINYSSESLKRRQRDNENPNVDRVRRMQRQKSAKPAVGRPIRPVFHKTRPQRSEKAWQGDISGRKLRVARSERTIPPADQVHRGVSRSRGSAVERSRMMPARLSGRARNTSYKRFYLNNQSARFARQGQRTSGAGNMLGGQTARRESNIKGRKITPRSASAAYLSRRSTNTWAHFRRAKRKSESAITTDLAGKKLRGKNYETQRPEVLINPTLRYQKRVAQGERPYQGPAGGGHVSRTKPGRAWTGDITHRAIRGGFRSKKGEPRPGAPLFGKGPGKASLRVGRYQGNIRTGRRGFGDQGEEFSGNIKSRRLSGAGGSVTRGWNNKGVPIQGRTPGKGTTGINYSGNIRVGKRVFNNNQGEGYSGNLKRNGRRGFNDQGEEYTGNLKRNGRRGFNNQGEEYTGNLKRNGRRGFNDQGEEYTGNLKRNGRRGFNDQGEGYTGNFKRNGRRGFNDQGEEYAGNLKRNGRRGFNDQGEGYTGNLKRNGRRGFNDQGEEYAGNLKRNGTRAFNDQGEEYTGNIKAHRFLKGGGSRSGKHWNNNNTPIQVRVPKGQSARIAGYQGNIRRRKTLNDQGEEYAGNIKARRPEKGGGSVSGKLWNNEGRPVATRTYSNQDEMNRYSGNLKARRPEKGGGSVSGKLWNNNERAIAVRTPKNKEGRDYAGDIKLARNDYKRNPKSAPGALEGKKASSAALKADVYSRGVRRDWDYIRNPSSADDAQRTREPGRAFGRSADYQGNIRIRKFDLFAKSDLHPDARFVRLNKNNVPEEKDMFTNFKLWWARLFRKSDTQPDHLKEKDSDRKPRYDKGESGLWYE